MTNQHISDSSPVFSSRSFDPYHFTLVNQTPTFVGGRQIICQNRCGGLLQASSTKVGNNRKKWRIACPECFFQTSYFWPDETKVEGLEEYGISAVPGAPYLRTRFPVPVKALTWKKNKAKEAKKAKKMQPPPVSASPSPSPMTSAAASPLPSPRLTPTPNLPKEVQVMADGTLAGLLPPPPPDASKGASLTVPRSSGSIRIPPRATREQARLSKKPPGPASPPKKNKVVASTQKDASGPVSGAKKLRATQPDTSSDESSGELSDESSDESSGPVVMAPMPPRIMRQPPKRPRADSSTHEQPPDVQEGSSKGLRKKRSRACKYSLRLVFVSC